MSIEYREEIGHVTVEHVPPVELSPEQRVPGVPFWPAAQIRLSIEYDDGGAAVTMRPGEARVLRDAITHWLRRQGFDS